MATRRRARFLRSRHRHHALPRRSRFASHQPGCRCVYHAARTNAARRAERPTSHGTGQRRYRQFHGRAGRITGRVNLPTPRRLILIGRAVSVVYVPPVGSGKFFRTRTLKRPGEYLHKFGPNVKLYTDERGRLVYIVGGKFRVTDWLRG